ncbi:N-acetylmuramoyl-L-alanine amidase [Nocardioides sp. SYSU DS0663]|uniref:N-acetylmuramoyl-L-alanine amidase n=1 Tax=Nocardioides sp. SYSU DS0663 TaxID=3416445 RepID=UPI003F4C4AF5
MTTTGRRPLLLALAGGTAAVAGLGTAARTGLLGGDDRPADGRLQLSAGDDMGVESLSVPLDEDVLVGGSAPGGRASARMATTTFSMVGFTWPRGAAEPAIEMSVRRDGSWQPWQPAPHAHEAPDPDSLDASPTVGTDVVWVGPTDGIRVRVDGERPAGLALVLLHPTPLPGDAATVADDPADDADPATAQPASYDASAGSAAVVAARTTTARTTTTGVVPRPNIRNRKAWGANENLRDGSPSYIPTIKQVHVHHTVNSNDYAREDVPALIRGMYAYHTQSLGWSDIGYNFLVDRFGRIWTGRYGGAAKNVRGAHTLGFNHNSAGVSVIGNFDQATPTSAVIAAIARVAAWKLDRYGMDPVGRVTVTSEGSDKYRSGRAATLPVIDGHRDTNDTSCPGSNLYAKLPAIREKTRVRIANFRRAAERVEAEITEPFAAASSAVVGRRLRIRPGSWTPGSAKPSYTWLRDGAVIAGASGRTYTVTTADVGARLSARVSVGGSDVEPATQDLSWPDPARARTSLVLDAAGRRGKARLRVRASAPGLPGDVPTGSVVVIVAGREVTLPLDDEGRATTVVTGLEPGTYAARAVFAGDTQASWARATDQVIVKPRRR